MPANIYGNDIPFKQWTKRSNSASLLPLRHYYDWYSSTRLDSQLNTWNCITRMLDFTQPHKRQVNCVWLSSLENSYDHRHAACEAQQVGIDSFCWYRNKPCDLNKQDCTPIQKITIFLPVNFNCKKPHNEQHRGTQPSTLWMTIYSKSTG